MSSRAQQWLAQAVVAPEVFALREDYCVMLLAAQGLSVDASNTASDSFLTAAEQQAAAAVADQELVDLPHLAQWREAYRSFGAKPQRTRPSVEALLRRAEQGLPRIDRITDAYNAVSVAHLLPIGGEDLDCYDGPPRLIRATGTEAFDTFAGGEQVSEHPDAGEVVWCDDTGVTCRRWNWRQGIRTRITAATTTAGFLLEGLGALGPDGLAAAAATLQGHLMDLNPDVRCTQRLITGPVYELSEGST